MTIAEDAKSTQSLALREPFSFRFSAVGYPEVTRVQPTPDAEGVGADALVTAMFNRPLVALGEQEKLPQPPPVSGQGEWLNTSIYTEKGFAPATTYPVKVAAA